MSASSSASSTFTEFRFVLNVIVVPTLFAVISLVGLVGNLLVIYVIVSNKRMRTVINLLLLNLAVADLCFVVIVPAFTAFQYIANEHPYTETDDDGGGGIGSSIIDHDAPNATSSSVAGTETMPEYPLSGWTVMCKLTMYIVNVTSYTMVYTLVLIAVVRYMTVVHNSQTTRMRTRRNVGLAVGAMWILALVCNIPVLYKYKQNETHAGCDVTLDVGQRLFITLFVLGYAFPLMVIALLSAAILRHLAVNRVTIARSSMTGHLVARRADMTQQASRLIIIVVVLFAVSWLPIHIHLLLSFYGTPPTEVRAYGFLTNSCLS